jgi:aspartate-semialdehyde dehydrogenase
VGNNKHATGDGSPVHSVAIVGATGMVGRRLAAMLIRHPRFHLKMVVGSDERKGQTYRAVWEQKERALREHYGNFWREFSFPTAFEHLHVSSFADLLEEECPLVFSSVPERMGALEEALLARGRFVFSNSPYRRFDPAVALVVPEVNGDAIEHARATRLVKTPNCVSSGLIPILAALQARFGLREVVVTTYQALSGRGDAKYDRNLVLHNIYPLHGSVERTEELIGKEVRNILGSSFPLSVTCNRTCVQEGHFVELRIRTRSPIHDREEAARVLTEFRPLSDRMLPSGPRNPITLVSGQGRPRPNEDAHHEGGMAIAVGNLTTEDEIFDLRLTYVVNNLVRGAAGGLLLNAEIWDANAPRASVPDRRRVAGPEIASV